MRDFDFEVVTGWFEMDGEGLVEHVLAQFTNVNDAELFVEALLAKNPGIANYSPEVRAITK